MSRQRPLVWLLQRTDAAGGVTVIVDALVPWLTARRPWTVVKVVQRDQAASNAWRSRPRALRAFGDAVAGVRLVVRLLRDRPDVVVTFTPAFGAVAALVARAWGGRTVVTHHLTSDAIGPTAVALDAWARRAGAVHAVLACSGAVADSFASARAAVVANGVPDVRDGATVAIDRAAVAQRWGVPEGVPLAVAVGRLAPVKHHRLVVEALADAPTWHLLIAGEGPERGALEAAAGELGVADRVHLIGRVAAADAWALMAVADAYVQPSRAEGMSLALLEALAMGAVCLASDIGPNVEVLAPDGAGRILPGDDAAAWAAALTMIAADPRAAAAWRLRARATYEARFGEARMLAGYEDAIADAVTS